LLRSKIGSLLGMPAEQVREERALLEMGLDSLMAVELRNWIEGHMEVNLPISALMKSQSLGGLIAQISDGIGENGSSVGSSSSDATTGLAATQSASATSDSTSGNATNPASPAQWTSEEAGQLLNNIDQLTDDQVSQLLSQVLKQM
jgi:acyl carrier protein